jgi:hypothetical protein
LGECVLVLLFAHFSIHLATSYHPRLSIVRYSGFTAQESATVLLYEMQIFKYPPLGVFEKLRHQIISYPSAI